MSIGKLISTANNDFTVNLYQGLCPSENLIFSPFSLHTVLGMLAQGARGDTRTEILEGLQFKKAMEDGAIAKGYGAINSGLLKRGNEKTFTLKFANRIYSRAGYGLNAKLVDSLKTHFKADFEQMDFSTSANREAAADKINKWVEATTMNKIKDLVSPDNLSSCTALILVNGIYFKGYWKHQFKTGNTTKATFHVTSKKRVQVAMMQNEGGYQYGKLPELDAEAVALPYRGGRLSMVIILPKDIDGLAKVQKNIGSILKGGKSLVRESLTTRRDVELSLPKFKVETTVKNLNELMEKLGMKTMFSNQQADFSGMANVNGNPGLFVTDVMQKAFIEVDEEGSEAAASSDVCMADSSEPPDNINFVVDHPFYFEIVDHGCNDMVLFSGHVINPSN